jgi:hypothetical protein
MNSHKELNNRYPSQPMSLTLGKFSILCNILFFLPVTQILILQKTVDKLSKIQGGAYFEVF